MFQVSVIDQPLGRVRVGGDFEGRPLGAVQKLRNAFVYKFLTPSSFPRPVTLIWPFSWNLMILGNTKTKPLPNDIA